MTEKEFDDLVQKITADLISSLPDDLCAEAKKVLIVTRAMPAKAQAGEDDPDDLLGLYEGVPLNERSAAFPEGTDRITLFRRPLLDMCRNRAELKKEIRLTLIHELGHLFGFDEDDLAARGLD
ncbi:MAG: metallopeptidase family protein [Spirochaetota bacterium]